MSLCVSIIDKDSDKKSAIFCVFEYLYINLTRKYKPLILFRT